MGAANAPTIRRSHHAACFASAIVVPGSTPPGAAREVSCADAGSQRSDP